MNKWNLFTLTLGIALSTSGMALADEKGKETDKLPLDDQFIMKAVVSNNAVLRLAELVESRSENPKVEMFASDIIAEHKKASDLIGKLVTDRKLAVVAGVEKELREEVERLSSLKGNEFDQAYLDNFIRHHEQCLERCKGQTVAGKEAQLVNFARECKTTLEDHLKRAREIRNSLPK